MKKIIISISIIILGWVAVGAYTYLAQLDKSVEEIKTTQQTSLINPLGALSVLTVKQGGTGASTLTGCLTGNGTSPITGTGSACGAGGGGSGGGTWATTTSTVADQNINYPLETDDIVVIGSNATTSSEFYFDPNTFTGQFEGSATTTLIFNTGLNPGYRSGLVFNETDLAGMGLLYDGSGSGDNNKLTIWDLSNSVERFTLTRGGRFGIATTSPYAALSVVGAGGIVTSKIHATSTTETSTFDTPPTFTTLTSALILTGAGGLTAEYTGASCTNQFIRSLSALGASTCATVGAADVSLANLTATDSTLTFSGTYTGATARTIGLNLGNANTWTVNQTFNYSSSTIYSSFLTASTTFLRVGLADGCLNIASGLVGTTGSACGAGGGSAYEIATTSSIAVPGLAYFTQTGGRTTLGSVATSSLSVGSSLLSSGTLFAQVGGTASSLSINTANTNTWSVLQNFNYSSSTIYSSFLNASSTNLFLGTGQGALYVGSGQAVKAVATSTITASTGLTYSGTMGSLLGGSSGNLTVNTSQNIATLSNLTTDGVVYTSGAAGTLNVDSGALDIARGGTNSTSLTTNTLMFFNGTSIISTTSEITFGSVLATSTTRDSVFLNNGFLVGTTTDGISLATFASSTRPQIALSAGAGLAQWVFRNAGGNLYIATTSVAGTATSTPAALTINNSGYGLFVGTTTNSAVTGLAVVGTHYYTGLTANLGVATYSLCLSSVFEVTTNTDAETCIASSKRFKKNIEPLNLGLVEVLKLKPSSFEYKDGSGQSYGFIAEDVAEVDPLLASYDDKGLPSGIRWSHITAMNTEAIQELYSMTGVAKKSAQDNWQWIVIALLSIGFIYQQWQIRKLKNQ